jgi:chloramphenicol 3-O phosphotransferase
VTSEAQPAAGKIILINGPSSAGKSTLAQVLQERLEDPFWHISIDHLRDAKMLPLDRIRSGEFRWADVRPAFFEGFRRCLPALAGAGNDLIVEHIVETEAALSRLVELLAPFDVFFVGLHCPLPELERREAARGDRKVGEARTDFGIVHEFAAYDLDLDSTHPLEQNVDTLIATWKSRTRPSSFDTMGVQQ